MPIMLQMLKVVYYARMHQAKKGAGRGPQYPPALRMYGDSAAIEKILQQQKCKGQGQQPDVACRGGIEMVLRRKVTYGVVTMVLVLLLFSTPAWAQDLSVGKKGKPNPV